MSIIPAGLTRPLFRAALQIRKNSPVLMFGGGVVGVIATTVVACRATLKLSEDLPEMKENLELVKLTYPKGGPEHGRQMALAYSTNAAHVARLYAPAVLAGSVSVGLLTGSHVVLTRRNTAAYATLATVSKAFDDYRARVENEVGKEHELDLYHGARTETVEIEGKKTKIKVVDPNNMSPYSRWFDSSSQHFQTNGTYNRQFILAQQNFATHYLQAHGHLFLNEVYDLLGIPRSPEAALVGWVIAPGCDGFVDFGLYEAVNAEFINGYEQNALLDFNVDGPIWNLI